MPCTPAPEDKQENKFYEINFMNQVGHKRLKIFRRTNKHEFLVSLNLDGDGKVMFTVSFINHYEYIK